MPFSSIKLVITRTKEQENGQVSRKAKCELIKYLDCAVGTSEESFKLYNKAKIHNFYFSLPFPLQTHLRLFFLSLYLLN